MKLEIMEFFTESGQVFLNPDDLFFSKVESKGKNGIISLIFYSLMLGLILGIVSGNIVVLGVILIASIIVPLVTKFIHSIFVFIFARLLGGTGTFLNTFNLISYSSVLNVLLIIGIALTTLNKWVILPLIILVCLWKMIIEIIAVSEEHNLGYARAFLSTNGIALIILVILMGLI